MALAAAASAVLAAPANALRLGPETPHSPNAADIATSYWVMFVVLVVLVVVINGALIAALLRFRERRGHTAARITAGRGVLTRIAAGLGGFALVILVFGIVMTERTVEVEESGPDGLTAAASRTAQVSVEGVSAAAQEAAEEATLNQLPPGGTEGEFELSVPPEGAPLEISAIAQQWLWRFEYPGGTDAQRIFSYGELVVPVDTAVVLNVDSTDVIHSWRVPALGGQIQAVPGTVGQTWFKADEEGTFSGQGTVFDGPGFPSMRSQVRVVSPEEYEAYVEGLVEELTAAQAAVEEAAASAAQAAATAETGVAEEDAEAVAASEGEPAQETTP